MNTHHNIAFENIHKHISSGILARHREAVVNFAFAEHTQRVYESIVSLKTSIGFTFWCVPGTT